MSHESAISSCLGCTGALGERAATAQSSTVSPVDTDSIGRPSSAEQWRVTRAERGGLRGTDNVGARAPGESTTLAPVENTAPARGENTALDTSQSFHELRGRLMARDPLSPRELLALQIRAGEIGLSVELVSKIADGILGVVRRLQTQQ